MIRTKDASGRAVAGVVIACKLSAVMWETLRSDSEGRCRISMAPAMSFRLSAAPEGARPLDLYFGGTQNEPEEVDLPILPPVRGRVVDPTGHPLPGVAVGRWVTFQADGSRSMIPFWGGSKAETDSDGRFSISPMLTLKASQTDRERDGWLSSMAFAGPGLPRIAVRTFRPLGPVDPIEIVLEPTRRVRVPIRRVPIVADAVLSSIVSIRPQPNADLIVINRPSRPSQDHGKSPEADLVEEDLPPGRYHLEVVLRDSRTNAMLGEASRELVVGPGEGPVELPPLLLDLPSFRKMAGQAAPEIEATDLDGRPSKLADLRGRVVVLDFWGYWCGPCIWELPNLARLQEEFEGRPLTIVALHDGSARSRVEYHQKTAMARERIWGGRELPLKVLLDRHDPENDEGEDPNGTGATIRRYGITKFPTTLVIDHEGKMVGEVDQADHARLASLLKSLMERAEAPGKK